MSTQTRREQEKEALRSLILDKARAIFVRDGYDQFNMRRLAAEIDYSPGTIYLHFANKAELFQCIVSESFAHLAQHLAKFGAESTRDPVAALKHSLRYYVDFGVRNPNDYRFAFMMERPPENGPSRIDPTFDGLRRSVRRCVEAGLFKTNDVDLATQTIWATIHGVTSLQIQKPSFPWVPQKKLIAQVIDAVVDGLARDDDKKGNG